MFEGQSFTYGDGGTEPYHAVVSTSSGGLFSYDSTGNMTSRKTSSSAAPQTLAWSPLNELLSVTTENGASDLVESYRYDAGSERIYQEQRSGSTLNWKLFTYFPHDEVKVVGATESVTRSYFFGGVRVAQKVGAGAVTYLHGDHLGSTVLTTPGDSRQQYHAYGRTRTGSVPTEWQYTGQELDGGTGLVYLHARYYDPAPGQFISPDTLVPEPGNVLAYKQIYVWIWQPCQVHRPKRA